MSFEVSYEEDLLPRIRDLIDGYSKDSILKEYLQNADDSEATELVVTFDRRAHQSLGKTIFSGAKNQALLLYNNSKFKEADFKAIVKISAQGKVADAHSTGRFGQGFSSSFSISDHPSFVSNGRAYWFDVLKKSVSKDKDRSIQGWKESDFGEIKQWLDTFIPNPADKDFNGTIFRLPLRTKNTAEDSEISHEIFSYNDFLKWCEEWKGNANNLLFLRHVHKLVLQEIDTSGNRIVHVEIKTKNSNEVEQASNKIQKELSGELLDICTRWKEDTRELPIFKYHHHFLVKFLENGKEKKKEESWAVVNGLFKGEGDSLLEQASKVLKISPNHRKVLPWAGVAIKLDNNKPLKLDNSKLYTFLPLPIKSSYPVHIHGWFDLNPKRTEITHDGAGDDKDMLIKWNNLLFQEGVGVAWAYLIDFIKKDCRPQSYYPLWPKNNDDVFDDYLLQGFYNKITELDCLKTQYKENKKWSTPSELIYILESNKNLFAAYQNHFPIITPKPPKYIVDGIKFADFDLGVITPEFIREYLEEQSEDIEFPVPLGGTPITMLSKKEWLLPIIEYCAEAQEDSDYACLADLPVQLDIDNNLHLVQENCLLDPEPKLNIFQDDVALFVDGEIVELLKGAENLPGSWHRPTLKNYLAILNEHIKGYKFDKKRIKDVIVFISEANKDEVEEALGEIQQLQIVYQSNETYGYLEANEEAPFLVSKEEKGNIPLLEKAGIKLIHPDYIDMYSLLKNHEKLIIKLSPESLITYLLSLSLGEYSFFVEKEIRGYLTDLLAQDISWFKKLSDEERGRLEKMPFIATENDNLYAISDDKKLFLPAGFTPPKIKDLKGEYEIVHVIDDKQKALFKKLGIEEQTAPNYINEVIIPYIDKNGIDKSDNIKFILEWLANEWGNINKELGDEEKDELISKLSNSSIVLNESRNRLDRASNFYHPDFYKNLPKFLQSSDFKPVEFEDDSKQKQWFELLTILGASTIIIPEHIVSTVETYIVKNNHQNAIELVKYISDYFEQFEKTNYEGKGIFEYLSDKSWMPAEKPKNSFLLPQHEFEHLQKPSALALPNDFMIAGGAHFSLSTKVKLGKKDADGEYSEKKIAEALGIIVKLPDESIYTSFRRLIEINTNNEQIGNKVLQFVKKVYKYLGRSHIEAKDIPDDIKKKSIFIRGHWIDSNKVFQIPVNLTGIFSWDKLVSNEDEHLKAGLTKLGVKESPDSDWLIHFLKQLPQYEKLENQHLNDAKGILKLLVSRMDELSHTSDILVLTKENQLIPADKAFIDDLAAYKNATERNEKISLCQSQFDSIAKHYNAISIADNINPKIDNSKSAYLDSDSVPYKLRLDRYICQDSFKSAILRLAYHEGSITGDKIDQSLLDERLPSKIQFMERLSVRYDIDDTWIYTNNTATTHEDDETLYLLLQDDTEDMCESITKYICGKSNLSTDSFASLNRVLRNQLSIEDTQNLLDKKNIKELPKKIHIDNMDSIFGDDQEHTEPEDSDHEAQDEDLDYTSDTDEYDFTEHKGGEILPPTNPKTSSDKNGRNKSRKDGGNKGSGSTTQYTSANGKRAVSPNDRKPVYVGKEKEVDPNKQPEEKERAIEIGNRGEDYILEHAAKHILATSNKFEKAQTNNKGYDITEVDSNGKTVRYIEVKTLTGKWGEGGVGITESQLEFAQAHDNWWLFVVENIDTENTLIHVLRNPVLQANRFMFDHSWKQLAVSPQAVKNLNPQIGEKYRLPDGICEILSVKPMGKLFKVKLKYIQSNKIKNKKFDPSWEKC